MKKLIILLLLIFPTLIAAHPHMFMDAKVTFVFNEKGMQGFTVSWLLDPMFSSSIYADFDIDKDKKFSEKEIKDIEINAFSNLKNYNYFVKLYDGKKVFRPDSVTNFTPVPRGERIEYSFFVAYASPILKDTPEKKYRLQVFDDTFFCDIRFEENKTIAYENNSPYTIDSTIRENEDEKVSYDNKSQKTKREGESYSGFASPYEIYLTVKRK